MDFELYSNMKSKKVTKTFNSLSSIPRLNEMQGSIDSILLKQSLCQEIKDLLESKENTYQLIEGLFSIEADLYKLNDKLNDNADQDFPNFSEMYRTLSPMILRAIWERGVGNSRSSEGEIIKGVEQALRVALEEELYFWKDQIESEQSS